MKFFPLLILFFLIQTTSYSQDFASPDTKWVYDSWGFGWSGIIKVFYEKDTIASGRNLKKFYRETTSKSRVIDTVRTYLKKPVFFHVEEGVVEYSDELIHFDTIYNFRAPIGKKWKIYFNLQGKDSMEVEILDTFRIKVGGEMLFAQSVEYSRRGRKFSDIVIENIGNKWHYFLPWDTYNKATDGGEGGIIRCFQNERLGTISFDHNPIWSYFEYDCDEISSNESKSVFEDLKIYPTPVRNFLTIESKFSTEEPLFVMDYLGRIIKRIHFYQGINKLDFSKYNPGMYFFYFKNEVYKVVKQ